MRAVAAIALTLLLACGAVAQETPPPHAHKPGVPHPKVNEGWAVIVCSVFTTASSVKVSAARYGQAFESIGEWTSQNNATKWTLPPQMAEAEKIHVQLSTAPADAKGSACLMYRRIPRYHFDFSGEASTTATPDTPFARCPCARGISLDEKL